MKQVRKSDLAIFLLSILLVLCSLVALGARGRERARRAVCLANLGQLTSAWIAYADENDGKIVNGAAGVHYSKTGVVSDSSDANIVERAWVGRTWGRNWDNSSVANTEVTEEQAKDFIHEGALWPLVGDERCYKCPVGRPYEWVNYAIVDAMNGMHRVGTYRLSVNPMDDWHPNAIGARVGETVLWIKNRNEIVDPAPAQRTVFIDEGAATPDSFWVDYNWYMWHDNPPVRHNDGTTVSWADGHVSEYRWKATETIEYGRRYTNYYQGGGFIPKTPEGLQDLRDFQQAVWGRLGYAPSD